MAEDRSPGHADLIGAQPGAVVAVAAVAAQSDPGAPASRLAAPGLAAGLGSPVGPGLLSGAGPSSASVLAPPAVSSPSGSPSVAPTVGVASSEALALATLDGPAVAEIGFGDAPPPRRTIQRFLEIVPGLVSWLLILAPVLLSFRWPQIVAWYVLTFDFYWLYKAVVLTGSVCVTFIRIRRTMSADWRTRAFALADPAGRLDEIEALIPRVRARIAELEAAGEHLAASGGRRELKRLDDERSDLARLMARRGDPIPDPAGLYHVALIPTYTEPFEKLFQTVRALAETNYPRELKMVAIITRETDLQGRENVARLRTLFEGRFLHFFHVLDPLEPGVVIGKSSAMAYGGRWLYGELVRLGYDPKSVVVTDLDSDYRVHPEYFGYLTWMFLTDPDRYRRLYQPVPMFHNNLWQTPLPIRIVAVGATHVQMWRSLTPEKLLSFSSYAVCLRTVHEVDYWATDAIPEDSRFYWKSFFRYSGEFRAVPLFIPMYGDAVRARSYPRTLIAQYTQIRRWAWGITDIPYYITNAFAHREIPRRLRIRRLIDLWLDHINWAIAPFVIIFGSNVPLLINPAFAETTLGQNLPLYAAWLLTGALCCLLVLILVEEQIAPARPTGWGYLRRLGSYLQWITLPLIGLLFSNLPALDAQTRLMAGKYLEYRVTEKV